MERRQIISALGGIVALGGVSAAAAAAEKRSAAGAPHNDTAMHVFNPRSFGAVGDGRKLDSPAIQRAIDACNAVGGGIVYVPPGTYLSGTIVFKSNVTLYLEAGAVILGSPNIADYKPQHLIFADGAKNIGLAGPGTIDGQGSKFWIRVPRPPVPEAMFWSDAIHLDWDRAPRPSPMIEFENCADLRIEDVHIQNAAGWTLRPYNCDRVVIQGITIQNPVYGPNTDGIDPTGCQDLLISDCVIETGDDAICLKSEALNGGEARLSRNIVVTNCVISGCCNGFKIGTATFGGFENITFSNSVIYNDDLPLSSRTIAGIQLSAVDGGWVEGVVITGIRMQRVRAPICLRRGTRYAAKASSKNVFRGVIIDGLHATDAILTSSITGLPGLNMEDIRLSNVRIETVLPGKPEWLIGPISEATLKGTAAPGKLTNVIPEVPADYPQSRMFGWLPVSGLFARHVRGLSLTDVSFTAPSDEWRPTLLCDDVTDLRTERLSSTAVLKGKPIVELTNVGNAWLSGSKAPQGSKALLKAEKCSDVLVTGCDLRGTKSVAEGDTSGIRSEFNVMGA